MKRTISIIGVAALFIGCFLPILHAPFVGSLSIANRPDGIILLVIIAIGAIAALCNKITFASVMGWISFLFVAFEYADLSNRINNAGTNNALANALIKASSPGEAWPVLAMGAIAMIIAGFLRSEQAPVAMVEQTAAPSEPRSLDG